MEYDAPLYRPPSEAYSLIFQVTLGCSHNKCTFCSAFKTKKFRIKPMEVILAEIKEARSLYSYAEKIFLADGDALVIPTPDLLLILNNIKEYFPECKRVGIYASATAINQKSEEELLQLKKAGLGIFYMGLESGNEAILKKINKGDTAQEMIIAGKKAKSVGMPLSITIISGIGGQDKIQEHALDTAKVLNEIDPDYVGLLTLMLVKGTALYNQHQRGEFKLLTPNEVMKETKILLENLNLSNCVFRANHASNYIPLGGTLPQDKQKLLNLIDGALKSSKDIYKKEYHRLL